MCTLALKEVVNYYTSRRGRVYCCLLDASKAFDRVRFDKLFAILQHRDIPAGIIRLLMDMYCRQKVRTVYQGYYSDQFTAANGVRQGGVLSPILFTLYIDVLLERLEESGIGCYVGHEYMGSLCSADDLSLPAPTLVALQRMIEICESYGTEYDISFNEVKTVGVLFGCRRMQRDNMPQVVMNGEYIKWSDTAKHLGNIVSADQSDYAEIHAKKCDFIGRTNSILANFKTIPRAVCSRLFMSQCCHLYGCQAWSLDHKMLEPFLVSWRKAIRKLWWLPGQARSALLPLLVGTEPIEDIVYRRVANLYKCIMKGHNGKMLHLLKSSVDVNNMGFIGTNIQRISKRWGCGYDRLVNYNAQPHDTDLVARAQAVKELTECRQTLSNLDNFSHDEIVTVINNLSCFRD